MTRHSIQSAGIELAKRSCNMRITIFLCFLLCASFSCAAKNGTEELNQTIQDILVEARLRYQLPAISLSIQLPGEKTVRNYVSGFYSASSKTSITPNSLFQIGSITKTFTATILYKLLEEKKVKVGDKLEKWLPQYPRWRNISINDLLRNTSGVYNYSSGKDFDVLLRKAPGKYWTLNELANLAYKHADFSKPGAKYHYTNTDYVLLGLIIEKASHQSIQQVFDAYLHQYNLQNTFYSPAGYPESVKTRIVHGYNRDGTFPFNKDVTAVSQSFGQSAGAMIAASEDLVKWLTALFTDKIISHQSLTEMTRVISEISLRPVRLTYQPLIRQQEPDKSFMEIGTGAGVGLVYFKEEGYLWVHAGGTPGYEAFYAYNPCKGLYLVLAYNVKPRQQLIFTKISAQVFKALNHSSEVAKAVQGYQQKVALPAFCIDNKG